MTVFLIDADHFKRVNDQFGHDVGDAVLQTLASAIANAAGGPTACARLGGEEFAVVLLDLDSRASDAMAERLRVEVASLDWASEGLPNQTISIGYARADSTGDFRKLLRQADLGLYAAKTAGRNATRDGTELSELPAHFSGAPNSA